jgi:hypothetical protein
VLFAVDSGFGAPEAVIPREAAVRGTRRNRIDVAVRAR